MAAVLWPHGVPGVLSHETALALYDLSDVNPAAIHLTVPATHRLRRPPPAGYRIHHGDLRPDEITGLEGLPITTVVRTLRDCREAHLGPALLRQALEEARRVGHLNAAAADQLEAELLPTPATTAASDDPLPSTST
jgi:predicted transcriptional regulator of viral defense system